MAELEERAVEQSEAQESAHRIRIEIGTTVFRCVEGAIFRFGTVLNVDGANFDVSFPARGRGRRSTAERFSIDDVLSAADISEVHDRLVTGARAVQDLGDLTVRVVEVVSLADDFSVVVSPMHLASGIWTVAGETYSVPTNNVLPAHILAAIEARRFASPVDPYYDVLGYPIGLKRTFVGDFNFDFGQVTLPISGAAAFSNFDLKVSGTAPTSYAEWSNSERIGDLLDGNCSLSVENATVALEHAAVSNWHLGSSQPLSVDLNCPAATVTFRSGTVQFTREILKGGTLAFAHNLWHREPPVNLLALMLGVCTAPDCIRTKVFGRPAIIYEPPQPDGDDTKFLAVFYHGAPLDEGRRRALSALIGYLCGGRSAHVATDTFDTTGILSVAFTERGDATVRKIMPVPLNYPGEGPLTVAPHLPKLLDGMYRELRRDRQGIEAALHHYSEGVANAYPTKAVGDMSVAIDALIASRTGDDQSNADIIAPGDFKIMHRSMTEALKGLFADNRFGQLSQNQRQRLQTKLDNLNTASNTKRFERFWRDIGVKLKRRDVKVLRKRHPALHRGYPEDEATRRALLRSHEDVRRLANLFNRAFLAMLGYEGPILDARTGKRAWLTVRRAAVYPFPPRPSNVPTLIIAPDAASAEAAQDVLKSVTAKSGLKPPK
jgi:hypothetical protein